MARGPFNFGGFNLDIPTPGDVQDWQQTAETWWPGATTDTIDIPGWAKAEDYPAFQSWLGSGAPVGGAEYLKESYDPSRYYGKDYIGDLGYTGEGDWEDRWAPWTAPR